MVVVIFSVGNTEDNTWNFRSQKPKKLQLIPAVMSFCGTFAHSQKQESPADADKPARLSQKNVKIAPIRRVSFHFTEFHFPKFQITNA